eukprot:6009464-Prymnesium_polylepis.1
MPSATTRPARATPGLPPVAKSPNIVSNSARTLNWRPRLLLLIAERIAPIARAPPRVHFYPRATKPTTLRFP